jgi:hypothetical protein
VRVAGDGVWFTVGGHVHAAAILHS